MLLTTDVERCSPRVEKLADVVRSRGYAMASVGENMLLPKKSLMTRKGASRTNDAGKFVHTSERACIYRL